MTAIQDHMADRGASVGTSLPSTAAANPSASIFHEPWYLDAVTDGGWSQAVVRQDGNVVGRLPYVCSRSYGLPVATMPRLVCTLGPALCALPGKAATSLRRRLEITNGLIDQIPDLAYFTQVFDPSVKDAAAFVYRGFVVGVADCFRIPPGLAPQDVWCGMQAARRQEILDAGTEFRVGPVDDREELFALDRSLVRGRAEAERTRRVMRATGEHDAGLILGARDRSGVLCAAIVLVWDSVAAYRLIRARRPGTPQAVESLLLWESISRVLPRGLAFDFGGARSLASLRFLAGFGDYLIPCVSVQRVTMGYRVRKAMASMIGARAA